MPTSTSPSEGEVAELNAKISELEAGLTELKGLFRALQEQSKNSMQQGAPTAPSGGEVAELNARVEKLEATVFHGGQTASQEARQQDPISRRHELLIQLGAWNPSLGMRHPNRPCMKNERTIIDGERAGDKFGCGIDNRSPEQIESDPDDKNNPRIPSLMKNWTADVKGWCKLGSSSGKIICGAKKITD